MKKLRAVAFAALSAALASCHEDPEIITVVVNVLSNGLTISADGGSASLTTAAVGGTGGAGGGITAIAAGPVTAGTAPTPPVAPVSPAAPTTGDLGINPLGQVAPGNLLIASLNVTADSTFTATNGDLVVTGTLQSDPLGPPRSLTLNALNGTVYISGTVRTSSTNALLDGESAAFLSINAARIVISGAVVALGEANAAGTGGSGGAVTLISSAGPLVLLSTGSIQTGGGSGSTFGGPGGLVALASNTGGLHLFGPVTTSGGPATGTATTPTGGVAGNLTLAAASVVEVSAILTLRGGAGTGTGAFSDGAVGGAGGDVSTDNLVPVRLFGTIDNRGGAASADAIGAGALTGGAGGNLLIGTSNGVDSVDLGLGTFSTAGGAGGAGGSAGGDITLLSDSGAVAVASDLVTRGGAGLSAAGSNGGAGGDVDLECDGDFTGLGFGDSSLHPVTLLSAGSIVTSGGAAGGGGAAGNAGDVTLRGGGDLTVAGTITATGGAAMTGNGGNGGPVLIQTAAMNNIPIGDVSLTGAIQTQGTDSTAGQGGIGGGVSVNVMSSVPGQIFSSSALDASGGASGGAMPGGMAGAVSFATSNGDVNLSGSIRAAGGDSTAAPSAGGGFSAAAGVGGGSVLFTATLNVSGGDSTGAATAPVAGGASGNVALTCGNASGFILLGTGTSIAANGGASTGVSLGGAGGQITMSTFNRFVSITGVLSAQGGAALGVTIPFTGVGGPGGAVQVHTDADNDAVGGDITLTAGSTINVSGGNGLVQGPARNDGPDNGVTVGMIAVMAVQFDADGLLTASGNSATAGVVVNNGTIFAAGIVGGDLLFDGNAAAGLPPTIPVSGTLSPASGTGGTDFVGQ